MEGGSRLCSKHTGIKNHIYELLNLLDENCNRDEFSLHAQDYNRDDENLDDEDPILRKYISDHGKSGDYYKEVINELRKLGVDIRP